MSTVQPFPAAEWFEGRRPYLEVRIERTATVWSAWFNGQQLGRIADDGTAKAAEFRLNTQGGRARVDSAVFERLEVKRD